MKKCPKCKFLVTDAVRACRFCGHDLDAPYVDPRRADHASRPAERTRRRTRAHAPATRVMASAVVGATAVAEPVDPVSVDDDVFTEEYYQTSPTASAALARRAGTQHGEHSLRRKLAIVAVGLLAVTGVGYGFVQLHQQPASTIGAAAVTSDAGWRRVGPPALPFSVEMPGVTKPLPLRVFDEVPTIAVQTEPATNRVFAAGAFDVPPDGLAAGAEALLSVAAERIAGTRALQVADLHAADRSGSVTAEAELRSASGTGWIELWLRNNRIYFAMAVAAGDATGVRSQFDRMVRSFEDG